MPRLTSFYVIGHPLGHSMSPYIHKRLFSIRNFPAEYFAKDIAPQNLEKEFNDLLKASGGINVTIPYKQAVIPLLDGLCGRAELYRSVNTVKISSDGCYGYNTDADGFLSTLRDRDVPLKGRVALIGCGGVGRTFACEAALAGCTIVNAVRNQDIESAKQLKSYVESIVSDVDYSITTTDALAGDFDLLINATPVGMYPNCDKMPVNAGVVKSASAVFDAVYNPADTLLLKTAKANGVKALGGMPMLVWQAVAAQKIWNDAVFNPDDINQLIEDASADMCRRFSK
ncbi:MAG: shikimate dehydrogenase [Oscillospiraceae bacterium]|nr:shikimate dehydrogenase [Oscillospiraceae bacterium]MDD4414081.1 shikimate dehydrogenase [Oscillospiraceae bacterium]